MNNEQQTWILKPDVKINDYKVMGSEFLLTESFKLELDGEMGFAPKYLFQPLDISGLTGQVEKQIHKAFIRGYEYGLKTDGEPSEDPTFDYEKLKTTIAEQVVLLLLNQEGDTKK